MKITNDEWNEGAPEKLQAGMLILWKNGKVLIHGGYRDSPKGASLSKSKGVKAWAWLIKPQELAWLEDMANKHKARARG